MSSESIGIALRSVLGRIDEAVQKRPAELGKLTRLVAVTKTKPVEYIVAAYEHGQRHFGENYVQELVEKSNDPKIKNLTDIKWHFIGNLQRNKCNQLASVPNLHIVETVNSERLATHLNNCWGKLNKPPLKVMVQLNTSQEQSKSGCPLDEYERIVGHVIHSCQHLEFSGLMTIGEFNYDYSQGPNPDFTCLVKSRKDIYEKFNLTVDEVELSMGMSADFEQAIAVGSNNVRVGSTIFGARENKPKTTRKTDSEEKAEVMLSEELRSTSIT